jgi:hypothetical protein
VTSSCPKVVYSFRMACSRVRHSACQKFRYATGSGLLQRTSPLQCLHGADDFNAVGPDGDHAADRPAVRPDVAGERLAHDADARTAHRVAAIEVATLEGPTPSVLK